MLPLSESRNWPMPLGQRWHDLRMFHDERRIDARLLQEFAHQLKGEK